MNPDNVSTILYKMAVAMRRACFGEDSELEDWMLLAEVALKVVREEDKRLKASGLAE